MPQTFLDTVEKSGLLAKEQVDSFLAGLGPGVTIASFATPQALAEKFVEAGLLTPWQVEKLLQGKHKGFVLGNYKLLRHLGAGGMSTVFLAEHKHMRQRRAIKVLPQHRVNDSSYLGRFYREARAAAALDHPNVVRAYDVDNDGDNHYLVMEFVEGTDIQKLVATQGVLSFEVAADYIKQAAQGLAHAHQVGLIHRDIKPANLLVDPKGTVKILDMGLARFSDDEKQASLTQMHDENVLGTADYLAPEQAINSHTVDGRADIYSLGCTLYFALTGHPPFPEGTLAQRLLMHQQREPEPISKDRPDVPRDLVAIFKRMTARDLNARYQSAAEVEDALGRWLSDRGAGGRGGQVAARQVGGPARNPAAGTATMPRGVPMAKPAEDSGTRGIGDTLSGSGQPTTKGPAGDKRMVEAKSKEGDSSSKLGGKRVLTAKAVTEPGTIGPPPAGKAVSRPADKRSGDSSGGFNFNINTGDDSNVLGSRSSKKPTVNKAGDSNKPTAAGGSAVKKGAKDAKDSKDAAEPRKLPPLRRKTTKKKMWVFAGVVLVLCAALGYGLYAVLEWQAAKAKAAKEKEKAAPAAAQPVEAAPAAAGGSTSNTGTSEETLQLSLEKPTAAPPAASGS